VMSAAPLTPGEDQEPPSTIDYAPENVPYDESFENELMKTVLYPPPDSHSRPFPSHDDLYVPVSSLPVPLSSRLRTHPSPIPGLFLTHPHGSYTGGPRSSASAANAFAERFISENNLTTADDLERKVAETMKEKIEEVKERFMAREEALEKNEAVRKDIKNLEVQRQAEVRVEERIRRDKEHKRGKV
ncbi:hypothetical protein GQ43DRAFT_376069, partial [Delitschia confertaspora ATCC 74209]